MTTQFSATVRVLCYAEFPLWRSTDGQPRYNRERHATYTENRMEKYWCGDFVSYICMMAGLRNPAVINRDAVRGKYVPGDNIACWSVATQKAKIQRTVLTPDSVYVKQAPGGGHIGFIGTVLPQSVETWDGNSFGGIARANNRDAVQLQSELIWCATLDDISNVFGNPNSNVPIPIYVPPPVNLSCAPLPGAKPVTRQMTTRNMMVDSSQQTVDTSTINGFVSEGSEWT